MKRAAVAAVAAALLLAGCTGSGKPKTADPASSTAASESPSPTASSTAASDPASSSPAEGSSAPSSEAASPTDPSQSHAVESSAAPLPTATSAPVPAGPNAKFANDPIAQSLLAYLVARKHALRAYDLAYEPMRAHGTPERNQSDKEYIQSLKDKHLAVQGEGYYVIEKVRRLGADRALVYLCEDDDQGRVVNTKTGALDHPVYNRWLKYEMRMVREQGAWKVGTAVDGTFACTGKLVP